MFRNKKDKEKNQTTSTITTGGTNHSSTVKTSSFHNSTTEQRTVTQITSRYSSVVTSKKEFGSSVTSSSNNGVFSSRFSSTRPKSEIVTTNSLLGSKANTVHQIDAKPFTPTSIGYQSPFSRKLLPLSSSTTDARPFNPQPKSNQTTTNLLSLPVAFPRNQPNYASSRPTTTNNRIVPLAPSSSTQSLPCTTETNHNRDPRIPTYNTSGKKRGKVLIINNVKFLTEMSERRGAELDDKNIGKLFKDMGFDVDSHRDLKQAAMLTKITKFRNDSSLKNVDMSVLIMMSHGNNIDDTGRVVHGGFTKIYGTDDKGLRIDEILNMFSGETCPYLVGKPKIFIFQCCRGEHTETLYNDVVPTKNVVKKHADMLIAFSTLPGFYSIRDIVQGSWYIQCICDVFKKHAKEFDVETLLKIVDQELSKKHPKYQQTSTYESRGFKCCFLNPK